MRLHIILALINFLMYFMVFSQSFEQHCALLDNRLNYQYYSNRPNLSGPELTIGSNNFVIHYTLEGCDSTTNEYANLVLNYAEYSRTIQVNEMNWLNPPEDGEMGGDNRYDIYIMCRTHLGANGKCVPENLYGSTSSYIIIVNDLYTNIPRLQSIVAHEFNHACQFAYTFGYLYNDGWFYENTASWMENITFKGNFDFLRYLNSSSYNVNPITEPGFPVNYTFDGYFYGGFLFPRFLTEWQKDLNLIRKIWESMSVTTSGSIFYNINNVLETNYSVSLQEALREYAVWRFFTGSRAISNRYFSIANLITVEAPIFLNFSYYPNNGNLSLKGIGSTSYIKYSWPIYEDIIKINFKGMGSENAWAASIIETRTPFELSLYYKVLLDANNNGYVLSNPRDHFVILVPVLAKQQSNIECFFSSLILLDKKAIKFSNIYGDEYNYEHLGGEFLLDNTIVFTSDTVIYFDVNTIHNIRTLNERFSHKQKKHNNWNYRQDINYFLNQVLQIYNSNNVDQFAVFNDMENVTIRNKLEGFYFNDSMPLRFNDPWYLKDSLGNQSGMYDFILFKSPFSPTGAFNQSTGGVFLNQGWPNWQPPFYSVKADAYQDIYLSHTGRTHRFYFQNWSANPTGSAEFKNANALETPVVFRQGGATVQANYKGSLLSNSVNAFAGGSQRKIVRTENGHLHLFYISMGKIWYEKSVNGGNTFYAPKIVNSEGGTAYSFSVDYWNNKIYMAAELFEAGDYLITLYQIDQDGNVNYLGNYSWLVSVVDQRANPVIGVNGNNVIVIWKQSDYEPLKFMRLRWDGSMWRSSADIHIPNTTNLSINPAISIIKGSYQNSLAPDRNYAHLVWEERESEISSQLYYIRIEYLPDRLEDNFFTTFKAISKGSGYDLCTNANIIGVSFDVAHIGFLGQRKFYPVEVGYIPDESRAVFYSLAMPDRYFSFGDDVQSVSLNRSNNRWVFAWSRGNDLPIQYTDSRDIRRVYEMVNFKGVDVQLTNGIIAEDINAFIINTTQSPYPIYRRAVYAEMIPDELVVTDQSREGVVEKEGGAVYYSLGDIKVGDEKIEFAEIPDTLETINLETANRYLVSKPFMVSDNTGFVYTIRYGVTDSTALKEALTNTDYITFRVELIDANTKEVLGVFDEVTYNSENVSKYENINYYVNTSGLGERLVQLRLVIMNNVDPYYALADKFSDAEYSLQKKKAFKEISYRGILSPREYNYNLTQNYPNPFNPTTKIKYSVKEDKLVTIKLYDMLGREVATLLNEVKSPGEYEIELDAQRLGLSSGVYLYQMKSGDFSSIKKLVFVK